MDILLSNEDAVPMHVALVITTWWIHMTDRWLKKKKNRWLKKKRKMKFVMINFLMFVIIWFDIYAKYLGLTSNILTGLSI